MIDEDFKIKVAEDVATIKTNIRNIEKQTDRRFNEVCDKIDSKFNEVKVVISEPVKILDGDVKRNSRLIIFIVFAILSISGKIIHSSFSKNGNLIKIKGP